MLVLVDLLTQVVEVEDLLLEDQEDLEWLLYHILEVQDIQVVQ